MASRTFSYPKAVATVEVTGEGLENSHTARHEMPKPSYVMHDSDARSQTPETGKLVAGGR
jgi:hypothetical protein